ncbi:MAG TPA: ABC transporter permease [Opitutaceae bacterium]|nr:ABC transporter permease [Opitutaceae bacterium]
MHSLIRDLRIGLRLLARNPGFTAVALLTLAIGIGANAAIFCYLDGILLRPVPYPDLDRMVKVSSVPPGGGRNGMSMPDYVDHARQNTVFEALSAQEWGSAALTTGAGEPVQVVSERVTAQFFDVFAAKAALGRLFQAGDDELGREHIAVISHSAWVTEFGADPHIIGRTVRVDREPHTIIGVLAAGAFDRTMTRIWRPLPYDPAKNARDYYFLNAYGKVKRGVTLAQARTQMTSIAIRLAHDFPNTNRGWGIALDPFASILVGSQVRLALYILVGAVGMVLLIACANLANLSLARGLAREREVAIRVALGASRGQLVRQFLTESLLVSVGGGILGVGVAYAGLAGLRTIVPGRFVPPSAYVAMDWRVLAFILVLSLFTGVLFGLVPALRSSRPDLTGVIKQGGGSIGAGRARLRLQGALIVADVALAFVLLTSAGLLIRSLGKLQVVDLGFDPTNVITADVPLPPNRFHTAGELATFNRLLLESVRAIPGVRDVALTTAVPLAGWGYGMLFRVEGDAPIDPTQRPVCCYKIVSPSYLRTLDIKLRRGRFLTDQDRMGSVRVAVINETMARRFLKDKDPLGKRLLVQELFLGETRVGQEVAWEIVGVLADEKILGPQQDNSLSPAMYVPQEQCPQTYESLVVRCQMNPGRMEKTLRAAVHAIDPEQPLDYVQTIDDLRAQATDVSRVESLLLAIFSGIALLLSAIGLFGVVSYTVTQRTREIGIRTALGATSRQVIGLVLRSGLILTAAGLLIGLAAAAGVAQVLASLLFNVGKYDPVTMAATIGILVVVTILACLLPARRAARVDPLIALRTE